MRITYALALAMLLLASSFSYGQGSTESSPNADDLKRQLDEVENKIMQEAIRQAKTYADFCLTAIDMKIAFIAMRKEKGFSNSRVATEWKKVMQSESTQSYLAEVGGFSKRVDEVKQPVENEDIRKVLTILQSYVKDLHAAVTTSPGKPFHGKLFGVQTKSLDVATLEDFMSGAKNIYAKAFGEKWEKMNTDEEEAEE